PRVAVAASNETRLGQLEIRFAPHVRCRSKRSANGHALLLGVTGLPRIRLTADLVLLGQARVVDGADEEVAAGSPCAGDDAASRADVDERIVLQVLDSDAKHRTRHCALSDDPGHPVLEEDLHALGSCALLERPHDAGAGSSVDRLVQVARPYASGLTPRR